MADLSNLTFDQLLALRQATTDPSTQKLLAPYEHQAYARETVASNPWSAPGLLAMIPAYQALKLMGLLQGDNRSTPASMAQLLGGYQGVAQGLLGRR